MTRFLTLLITSGLTLAWAPPPEALFLEIPNPYQDSYTNDFFGSAMASDLDRVAVGSPRASVHEIPQEPGVVKLYAINADVVSTTISSTYTNPREYETGRFGAAIAMDYRFMLVGAPDNPINGNSLAGEVFCYDVTDVDRTPYRTLTNPNPEGFERFGSAVAIGFHDTTTRRAAVSGLGINTAAAATGIVHVFDYLTTGAPLLFSIPNPTPDSGEFFGQSLSLGGHLLAVGNPGDEGGKGSVDIYDLSSATPSVPMLHLTSPLAATETENFGFSLSLHDGHLMVGAPMSANYNGRAYHYDLTSATPTIPAHTFENPTPGFVGETFGASVSLVYPHVLIGTPLDLRDGANQYGSAYRYLLTSATPTQPTQTYISDLSLNGGHFGASVALSSSGGVAMIGMPYNNRDGYASGAMSSIGASGQRWHHALQIENDEFGTRLDMDGPLIVVGSPLSDVYHLDSGLARVYDRTSGTPEVPILTLANPEPDPSDEFGSEVVISGRQLAVAAPSDADGINVNVGTVYVYDLDQPNPDVPKWTIINPQTTNRGLNLFGSNMAMEGQRLVISRSYGQPGQHGKVSLHELDSATPSTPTLTLSDPTPVAGQRFGADVDLSGSLVAVAATRESVGGVNAGMIYIFDLASTTPLIPIHAIPSPVVVANAAFGIRLRLHGQRLLAALEDENPSLTGKQGKIYAFDLSSATPTTPVFELSDPAPATDRELGLGLALDGEQMIACSPYDDGSSINNQGVAYRYDWNWAPAGAVRHTYRAAAATSNTRFGQAADLSQGWAVISSKRTWTRSSGSLLLFGPTQPEIVVEQPLNVELVSGGPSVNHGYVVQGQSSSLSFRLRNTGADPLEITSAGFFTGQAAEFSLGSVTLPLVIAPASSALLPVVFQANTLGSRQTQLRIINTDADEDPFSIDLTAFSVTARQFWRHQYFATIEPTGPAADQADPDGDGFDNEAEFITGTVPIDASSRLRLAVQPHPILAGQKRLLLSPTRTDVNYRIDYKTDLSSSSWLPLWEGMGSGAEQMIHEDPGSAGQSRRFYKLSAW